jgi:hypothetical protein
VAVGAITTVPIIVGLAQAKRESEERHMIGGRMSEREYASRWPLSACSAAAPAAREADEPASFVPTQNKHARDFFSRGLPLFFSPCLPLSPASNPFHVPCPPTEGSNS